MQTIADLRAWSPLIALQIEYNLIERNTRGTGLHKSLGISLRVVLSTMQLFMKSVSEGAATQALLAASPHVTGITGEYWSDCQIAEGNPLLNDSNLAKRLWKVSAQIVAANNASQSQSSLAAARMRMT